MEIVREIGLMRNYTIRLVISGIFVINSNAILSAKEPFLFCSYCATLIFVIVVGN